MIQWIDRWGPFLLIGIGLAIMVVATVEAVLNG